jgi:branched-chain amino acid transport system ATP-binding protein
MTAPLLALRGIEAAYTAARVLFGISLEVAAGEIVVLAGRNGAGKSTTLRCTMGLMRQARGAVLLDGRDISGEPPFRRARLGLGWVPEDRRIFPDLTVLENLEVGRRGDTQGWTPERLFDLFPNLAELRHRPGGQMSGGEQQMLAIGRTLMGNPRVLLLDEPSEGLAPVIVAQLGRALTELKSTRVGILLCEQNVRFAGRVADRGYIIESGHIRGEVDRAQLAAGDPRALEGLAL